MVFCCLRFPPKNEQKQVDLRHHSSKVEFFHSYFGGNQRHQKPLSKLSDLYNDHALIHSTCVRYVKKPRRYSSLKQHSKFQRTHWLLMLCTKVFLRHIKGMFREYVSENIRKADGWKRCLNCRVTFHFPIFLVKGNSSQ